MKNYKKPEIEFVSLEVEEDVTITGGVGSGVRPGTRTSAVQNDEDEF